MNYTDPAAPRGKPTARTPELTLWRFLPDGHGGGDWARVLPCTEAEAAALLARVQRKAPRAMFRVAHRKPRWRP